MWLNTTMQPPVAGIFSPSIQVRLVVASSVGLTIGTAKLNAQPRFCCSLRTVTEVLRRTGPGRAGGRTRCPEQATPSGGRIGVDETPVVRGPGAREATRRRQVAAARRHRRRTRRGSPRVRPRHGRRLPRDAVGRRGAGGHRRRRVRGRPGARSAAPSPGRRHRRPQRALRLAAAEAGRRWPDLRAGRPVRRPAGAAARRPGRRAGRLAGPADRPASSPTPTARHHAVRRAVPPASPRASARTRGAAHLAAGAPGAARRRWRRCAATWTT